MSVWKEIEAEIAHFTMHVRQLPILPHAVPSALRQELENHYTFATPLPADQVIADITALFREGIAHVTHPRCFGLFNPSIRQIGIVADAFVALYNPQLTVWKHAPLANELERLTLHCLHILHPVVLRLISPACLLLLQNISQHQQRTVL